MNQLKVRHPEKINKPDTTQKKSLGLMKRISLPKGYGMFFPFTPSQKVSFWMKDTLIPLDMIFLLNGFVIALETNVQPCFTSHCPVYGPDQKVDGVIELAAGEAKRLNIRVGDPINIKEYR